MKQNVFKINLYMKLILSFVTQKNVITIINAYII